eukprot:GHVN01024412.1.p1 GENE.GHVN01024412.1~~GHVN01024412.1.p1  ORF type:complete len:773 (-),score=197.22 GHVN01024412.1:665-2851(-)
MSNLNITANDPAIDYSRHDQWNLETFGPVSPHTHHSDFYHNDDLTALKVSNTQEGRVGGAGDGGDEGMGHLGEPHSPSVMPVMGRSGGVDGHSDAISRQGYVKNVGSSGSDRQDEYERGDRTAPQDISGCNGKGEFFDGGSVSPSHSGSGGMGVNRVFEGEWGGGRQGAIESHMRRQAGMRPVMDAAIIGGTGWRVGHDNHGDTKCGDTGIGGSIGHPLRDLRSNNQSDYIRTGTGEVGDEMRKEAYCQSPTTMSMGQYNRGGYMQQHSSDSTEPIGITHFTNPRGVADLTHRPVGPSGHLNRPFPMIESNQYSPSPHTAPHHSPSPHTAPHHSPSPHTVPHHSPSPHTVPQLSHMPNNGANQRGPIGPDTRIMPLDDRQPHSEHLSHPGYPSHQQPQFHPQQHLNQFTSPDGPRLNENFNSIDHCKRTGIAEGIRGMGINMADANLPPPPHKLFPDSQPQYRQQQVNRPSQPDSLSPRPLRSPPPPSSLQCNEASSASGSAPRLTGIPNWVRSLEEETDERVLVMLRDGQRVVGYLRSFDSFGNLMLEDSRVRMIAGRWYTDVYKGCMIVRGENIVLFGALSEEERQNPKKEVNQLREKAEYVDEEETEERAKEWEDRDEISEIRSINKAHHKDDMVGAEEVDDDEESHWVCVGGERDVDTRANSLDHLIPTLEERPLWQVLERLEMEEEEWDKVNGPSRSTSGGKRGFGGRYCDSSAFEYGIPDNW